MAEVHTGTIWSGADPGLVVDAAAYEMGSVVQALRPVTLTGIRIFGHPSGVARAGRAARLWNPLDRTLITSVPLPATMPAGWHEAPISYPMAAGDTVHVTYDTQGGYAFVNNAFTADRIAADGAMRFPKGPGNGRFRTSPAGFPDSFSATSPFYGIDVAYTWEGEAPPPPPPTPGTLAAHSALVAAAWLNAIPGLDAPAATSRPSDPSSWSGTGFLVASVVGSAGERDLAGQRKPIVSVDAWAVSPGSSRPPRGKASALLEIVRAATEDPALRNIAVVPVSGSVSYAPALVQDVWLETAEPREIPDPDSSYAHFSMDLGLAWVRTE